MAGAMSKNRSSASWTKGPRGHSSGGGRWDWRPWGVAVPGTVVFFQGCGGEGEENSSSKSKDIVAL